VIPPEQLAGALARLDPRERELLALSLRRRVPDEALARVYDVVPQEVARRRAAAIERLADVLGAQRGEDLGAVLQALLDESSWSASEASVNGEEVAATKEGGASEASGNGEGVAAPEPLASDVPQVDVAAAGGPGRAPVLSVPTEPVLEMLAAREGLRGPGGEAPAAGAGRGRIVAAVLGSFAAAVIGGAAAFVGLSEWGSDDNAAAPSPTEPARGETTKHFVPQLGGPFEAPFPSEPQPIDCYSIASTIGRSTLYRDPGGPVRIRLSPRTEWNSPRIFGVVRHRGEWIAVQAPELGNGELAWMPTNRARIDCVRWSMHVDLSRRRLLVEQNGKPVRRFEIAIGRRGNPTPRGRFSVTDKLRVTDPGSPYGCCVLALTGHQTRLPASWPGGDRLAVHATRELSTIGKAASLGCMRVTPAQARWLIRTIPLGAPVFVRS
jgi:hypothetical protein